MKKVQIHIAKIILTQIHNDQVFLVGKDFGGMPAYIVAALHPDRVAGVVSLGIPFMLPGPAAVQSHLLPEGFYVSRWQV